MTAPCRPHKYTDADDPYIEAAIDAWKLAHYDRSLSVMTTIDKIADDLREKLPPSAKSETTE